MTPTPSGVSKMPGGRVSRSRLHRLRSRISEADLQAATEIHKKERSDFLAIEAELVDTIDTLDRAVSVLERKGAALVQAKINGKDISQVVQALSTVLDAAERIAIRRTWIRTRTTGLTGPTTHGTTGPGSSDCQKRLPCWTRAIAGGDYCTRLGPKSVQI